MERSHPTQQIVPITHGWRRAHRPDLKQGMLALVVAHQADFPVPLQPLSSNRSASKACGQVVSDRMAQLHTPSNPTSLVADSALSSAENRHKLADTSLQWSPRLPVRPGLKPRRSCPQVLTSFVASL